MVAPRPKFYHKEAHEKKFGNPNAAENKDRGHKVTTIHGVKGVSVPTCDPDEPWEIERRLEDCTELEQTNQEAGTSESEDFEGEMQQKYDDVVEEEQAAYDQAVVGQTFEALMRSVQESIDDLSLIHI